MVVYADPKTSGTIGDAMAALSGLKGDDRLVADGMVEQALADAGFQETVGVPPDFELQFKTPEGFAFYEVKPEQYRRAARRWTRESGSKGDAVVIGIRSIGTTLSHIVLDELL